MNIDELVEKCRLTDWQITQYQEGNAYFIYPQYAYRMLEAQLCKAIPIIQKAERERIIRDLEAIDRDAYDVKDFTRRVCDLIVEERQSLKGEGDD
jgi:hypothetical protein